MQRFVMDWLDEAVKKYPDKTALSDDSNKINYCDLQNQAKSIATYLVQKEKMKRRNPIVVFIDRNITSIISFFGVAYSGCFYVPVDRQMPIKRIQLIFETLNPAAVIGEENDETIIKQLDYQGKYLNYEEIVNYQKDESLLKAVSDSIIDTDPLYSIFTSGSTGVPKGVLVSHRSVIDLIDEFTETFDFTETCIFGNQAPFDFDVSVKDIYSTIKNAATMYVIPKVHFSFPGKLIAYLNERKINTIIWATSALRIVANLKSLSKDIPRYLQTVMFSGEVMPNKVLNYWRSYLPNVKYINLYGPTEITCNCTYYKVARAFEDDEVLPIGITFKNTDIILLDENDKQVLEGNTGEICVRGSSLALGYYNNAAKTQEAFCQNPLNKAYPELIYRTGDLGYYNINNELMFVSRKDHQIKHMGHRIELGEIEVAINALPFIDAACCIYDNKNEKIVLFYQAKEQCDRELLVTLGSSLPKYMFPNKLVYFEALPLNKNAKIDRTLLKEKYID